tara:strand:- start:8335 stop:9186 length:852 start_codon:yes stop_codon:yes gene_type:complete
MKKSKIYICPKSKTQLYLKKKYYYNKEKKYFILENLNHEIVDFLNNKKTQNFYLQKKFYKNYISWLTNTLKLNFGQIRQELFDDLKLKKKINILFIGCGFGDEILFFINKFGKNFNIYAQDISKMMVLESSKKLKKFKIKFSISDASNLPYKNNLFDFTFHFGGINQFKNKKNSIYEMNRITKNGGIVIFSDEGMSPWLKKTETYKALKVNNSLWSSQPPINTLPVNSKKVTIKWILKENFYLIKYFKNDKKIDINYDIKHKSPRGGSIRSRYESFYKRKLKL